MLKLQILLLPLALTAASAAHAQANLLANPSFEGPALTATSTCDSGTPWCWKDAANTPGWTQSGNGVTLLHNNYLGGVNPPILLLASDGVQYLDMNQVGGANGGIAQVVAATPGQTYRLSLDVGAWATNAVGAAVGYRLYEPFFGGTILASGSFTAALGGVWTTLTLEGTATSTAIGVEIFSTFAPQAAIAVDNVVLTAVPEPGTAALLLPGLAALLGAWRRRRR